MTPMRPIGCLLAAVGAVAIATGLGVVGCEAPAPAEESSCTITQAQNGTIEIECPGGSATIPSCYANLPDLNGDGNVDASDCAFVGVGPTLRTLCSEPQSWLRHAECRAIRVTNTALALDTAPLMANCAPLNQSQPRMAAAGLILGSTPQLVLAVDGDRDGNFAEEEISRATVAADVMARLVATSGELAALMYDTRSGTGAKVYMDHDRDFVIDDDEVHAIDLPLADVALVRGGLTGARLAAVYEEAGSGVRLWVDLNDDFVPQAEETQLVDSGVVLPTMAFTGESHLVVAAYANDTGTGYLWEDSDGDWAVDEQLTPIADCLPRRIVAASAMYGNFAAICSGSHGLWLYPSAGRGLGSRWSYVDFAFVADPQDQFSSRLAAFGTDGDRAMLWFDANGDLDFDELEATGIWGEDAVSALVPDGSLSAVGYSGEIASVVSPDETRFLGEACEPEAGACAGGFECRLSGFAPEPRCVPPGAAGGQ